MFSLTFEDLLDSFLESSLHGLCGELLIGPGVFGTSGVSDSEDFEDLKCFVLARGGFEQELSESSSSEEELKTARFLVGDVFLGLVDINGGLLVFDTTILSSFRLTSILKTRQSMNKSLSTLFGLFIRTPNSPSTLLDNP